MNLRYQSVALNKESTGKLREGGEDKRICMNRFDFGIYFGKEMDKVGR